MGTPLCIPLDPIFKGTAVTNLTSLDFPKTYGSLELDRLIMPPGGAFPLGMSIWHWALLLVPENSVCPIPSQIALCRSTGYYLGKEKWGALYVFL